MRRFVLISASAGRHDGPPSTSPRCDAYVRCDHSHSSIASVLGFGGKAVKKSCAKGADEAAKCAGLPAHAHWTNRTYGEGWSSLRGYKKSSETGAGRLCAGGRLLPDAFDNRALEIDGHLIAVNAGCGVGGICMTQLEKHEPGQLDLPMMRLEFAFKDMTDAEIDSFMDMYEQRTAARQRRHLKCTPDV